MKFDMDVTGRARGMSNDVSLRNIIVNFYKGKRR